MSFAEDAARWETGRLTLDELESLHPGEDVRRLADLSGRLAAFGEMPTPDPAASWAAFRDQLPERLRVAERVQRRFRRSLVPVMAAAVLGGTSIAYAAGVEPVRQGVDRVAHNVAGLFNRDDGSQGNVDNGGRGDLSGGGQGDADDGDRGNTGTNEGDSGQSNDGSTGTNEGSQDDQGNTGADEGNGGNTGTDEGGQSGDEGNTSSSNSGDSAADQSDEGNTSTNTGDPATADHGLTGTNELDSA